MTLLSSYLLGSISYSVSYLRCYVVNNWFVRTLDHHADKWFGTTGPQTNSPCFPKSLYRLFNCRLDHFMGRKFYFVLRFNLNV